MDPGARAAGWLWEWAAYLKAGETDPGSASLRVDLKDAGQPVRYENADPAKRYLWLSDTSATGRGFEALETDAAGIELGDLVGWRRAASGPMMLGRVIRRLPSATQGQVFLGVQQYSYHALTGDEAYTLKFNRARNKGRGWILAGFEVVPAKRVEVATSSSS